MIDIFDSRTMLAALEEIRTPKSFLLDTFFPTEIQSDTDTVDIDIYRGKRRLAPFVKPVAEGKLVERIGYQTKTYKPPYIKPKMVTTAADILKRGMGNIIYANGISFAQRAAEQVGRDLAELQGMIRRREEWMAAQALNTGVINIVGDGFNESIDFDMTASHKVTLTGTALWTDAASDPLTNLTTWGALIAQDSGIYPNVAILGQSAANALLKNVEVRKVLDLSNYDVGSVSYQDILESGARPLGLLNGIELFSYFEWYLDDAGVEQPMVPADKVFLGSTNAYTARHYAAIKDLDADAAVKYFPKSWKQPDPSAQFIMVQSAPLVAPHQIDAFMSIKVV